MLGVGHGATLDLYNTCFVIQNDIGNFLIDTGGSTEIIKRLNNLNIDIRQVKNIFISHSHTDHILGLIWMLKRLGVFAMSSKVTEKINVYCNDTVYEAIIGVSKYTLPEKLVEIILNIVDFHILNDNQEININSVKYKFFDIHAKGTKQFGFECKINEKRLVFLGDEPLNPDLYERVENADYVMHEAFCLDSEASIFHPYEKNHSTAKSVSKIMKQLNVKNLILYHTEETHGDKRKELYTIEAKEEFLGNVYVPDELETIEI